MVLVLVLMSMLMVSLSSLSLYLLALVVLQLFLVQFDLEQAGSACEPDLYSLQARLRNHSASKDSIRFENSNGPKAIMEKEK